MSIEFRSIELLRELTATLSDRHRRDWSNLQAQVTAAHERHERAESTLSGVLTSRSWRMTEFLRRIVAWMRPDPVGGTDTLDQKLSIDESALCPPLDVI